jgi:hypothetical protein
MTSRRWTEDDVVARTRRCTPIDLRSNFGAMVLEYHGKKEKTGERNDQDRKQTLHAAVRRCGADAAGVSLYPAGVDRVLAVTTRGGEPYDGALHPDRHARSGRAYCDAARCPPDGAY